MPSHNHPICVLHPITRLIVGGAQENTMLTADYLAHDPAYQGQYIVDVVSGPQTGPEGSIMEEVRARGTQLIIMPVLLREISPLNDLKAFFQLRQLMKQGHYDIVHTHSSKAGVLGRLAAKSAGIPHIVHTVHGWSFHDQMSNKQRALYVALEKLALSVTDATIVVSPYDIDKGLAQGIGQREDYTLIRSGIELDRFGHPNVPPAQIRAELGIPADAVVVGSVTRLSPQKAPLDLIEAFAQVAGNHPDVWFVVVGDGPLRPDVEAKIQASGLANRLILTGLRRDVPELLATFDMFVMSSLWEGLPRALLQAMATSLPVICTQADGTAEVVEDGVNGFLVTRGDVQAIAGKINQLLDNPSLRIQMGMAGHERVSEFGARRMVQHIHTLYQQLLHR